MNLRQAAEGDLKAVAQCHRVVFPASLTSKMGVNYLTRIFSWYLSTNKTFLFFIENDGLVVGYCGGMIVDGTLAHGSASSMAQYTFSDAIIALAFRPWLLFHSELLMRYRLLFKNILFKMCNWFRKSEVRSTLSNVEPYAGLVVIGVHPNFQGKGYGATLLGEFEKQSALKKVKRLMLSVKSENIRAIRSYMRNGWTIQRSEGKSVVMQKNLV